MKKNKKQRAAAKKRIRRRRPLPCRAQKKNTRRVSARQAARRRRLVSLAGIAAVAALFMLLAFFVGKPLIRSFRESPEAFRAYVDGHRLLGALIMLGITMLQVIVAFIPGEPFELGAGFAFGWFWGAALCLIGAALASALVFLAVRKWGIRLAEVFFPREKLQRFAFLQNEKKLSLLVFLLFLIPGTPKDMLTYLVGLTPMKLPTFLLLITVARVPSVVSSSLTGSLAQEGSYLAAAVTYGVTLLLTAACVLRYRSLNRAESAARAV